MKAADPNSKGPRRLTAADRVRRNAQILADRASGESLTAIANRHGLTSRQVRSICNGAEGRLAAPAVAQSEALVMSVLAEYDSLARDLDRLSRRRNPNTELGAVKAKLQLLKNRTAFLVQTGLIPGDVFAMEYDRDAMQLAETIIEVFDRYDVPDEVQLAVVEAVESQRTRSARLGVRAEAQLPLEGEARDV
jgi:hypothetical protein